MNAALKANRKNRKQGAGKTTAPVSAGSERKPVRGTKQVPPEITPDLDMEWLREASDDVQEAEVLADKVFASVLERCGWQRNERGEIEHIGDRE